MRTCVTHHHACDCREERFMRLGAALIEARKGLEFYGRELGVNGAHPRKGYMMDGVADFELHTDGMYYGGKTARTTLSTIGAILSDDEREEE